MPHLCHWPDCQIEVPPHLWGCRTHWFMLPKRIRQKIWFHYHKGQETDKKPSAAYITAAHEAQNFALNWKSSNAASSTLDFDL